MTALAQRLITQARRSVRRRMNCRLDLTNTVYAEWTRRPSLCRLVTSFRRRRRLGAPHKGGQSRSMHTLLDLRWQRLPSFIQHLGWQAARRSACPPICWIKLGSRSPATSWIVCIRRLCPPLCVAPSRGLLRHDVTSRHIDAHRVYSAPTVSLRSNRQFICRRTDHPRLGDELLGQRRHGLPRTSAAHPLGIGPASSAGQDAGLHHHVTDFSLPCRHRSGAALQKPLAGGTLPGRSSWIEAASSDQAVATARQENAVRRRRSGLPSYRSTILVKVVHRQEAPST